MIEPVSSGVFSDSVIETLSGGGQTAERLARQLAGERRILEHVATGQPMRESLVQITGLIETISEGSLASVLLLDHENRLRHGAAPQLPAAYNDLVDGIEIGPNVGSCGTAAYLGEPVIVGDVSTDPRWSGCAHLALDHGLAACWSVPIRDDHGEVIGTFAVYFTEPRVPTPYEVREVQAAAHLAGVIISKERSEQNLLASEARFRSVIENAPDSFFLHDPDGNFVAVNQRACDTLGYSREELLQLNVVDVEAALDLTECRRIWAHLINSADRTASFEGEHRRKDGTRFPVEGRMSVIDTPTGPLLYGFVQDISERKQAENSQRLLMRELDHRVKNNLASVLSIAQQMISRAPTLEAFNTSFVGRIQAMAAAHDLLAKRQWHGATVESLVRSMLLPYEGRHDASIQVTGCKAVVDSRAVQPLCLTLHELITNAAKHGAFSGRGGRVNVTWQVDVDDGNLTVAWHESSEGEAVSAAESGFGEQLIRDMIPHQLHGSVDYTVSDNDVRCVMVMPMKPERTRG